MWLLIIIAIASAVLTGVFRHLALKYSLIDHPNSRSSHKVPTPRGGGISVVLSFLAGTVFLWWDGQLPGNIVWPMVVFAGIIALIGLIDDHRHISAGIRICVHAVSAIGVLYFVNYSPLMPWFGYEISLGITGYIITAVSLVWLLNLYNFMDGIDGIAGVEAICVAGGGALIIWFNNDTQGYDFWLLLLVASTVGFLFWNWPPAKIFMGDSCSGFLGFVFGVFALVTSSATEISLWSWFILLGFFLTDASITLIRRIFRKEKFYKAHRCHGYQILSRQLKSHLKVTLACLFINVFWLFPLACLASFRYEWGAACGLIAFFPLVVLALRSGAGTTA